MILLAVLCVKYFTMKCERAEANQRVRKREKLCLKHLVSLMAAVEFSTLSASLLEIVSSLIDCYLRFDKRCTLLGYFDRRLHFWLCNQ